MKVSSQFVGRCLILGAIICVIAYAYSLWVRALAIQDSDRVLSIHRITSTCEHEALSTPIIAESGRWSEVVFEITNLRSTPLDGLHLRTTCNCQVTRHPAETLQPGASTETRVRVRAPVAGDATSSFPILAAGWNEPIGELVVTLQASIKPPALLTPLHDLQLTAVAGDATNREIPVQTVELNGSERWIQDIHFDPPDVLSAKLVSCTEKPLRQPHLLQRNYRFNVRANELPVGTYRAMAQFRFARDADATQHPHPVTLAVHDVIAVFPNPIRIELGQSKRVVVVRRSDVWDLIIGQCSQGFSIQPAEDPRSGNSYAFNIRTNEQAVIDRHGTIEFLCRRGTETEIRKIRVE